MSGMTIDNWGNLILLIALMCMLCWIYKMYAEVRDSGDYFGVMVFKWMARVAIIFYILSLIYNLLCHVGIIDDNWYVRWFL